MIYLANGLRRFILGHVIPKIMTGRKKIRDNQRDEFLVGKKIDKQILIHQSECSEVEIYDDYMELVIEYGFLTLFAESFILAPLAILILNKLEKFSDITRFKSFVRRPEFTRKRNIGMWGHIIQVQSVIAIFTNLSLTLMMNNDNSHINYLRSFMRNENDAKENKLSFKLSFFIIEHFILLVLIIIWLCMNPVAKWVERFLERRDYRMRSNKWKLLIEDLDVNQKSIPSNNNESKKKK